jgi:hypothetical protein
LFLAGNFLHVRQKDQPSERCSTDHWKNEAVTIDFIYIYIYLPIDAFSLLVRHIYKCWNSQAVHLIHTRGSWHTQRLQVGSVKWKPKCCGVWGTFWFGGWFCDNDL